jgi:hypothetical protein
MLTLPTPKPSYSRRWYQSFDDLRSVGTVSTRWLGRAESHATVRAPAHPRWQEAEMDLRYGDTKNRARYDRSKLGYPSDVTDDEWRLVEPLIPSSKTGGGKRTVEAPRQGETTPHCRPWKGSGSVERRSSMSENGKSGSPAGGTR